MRLNQRLGFALGAGLLLGCVWTGSALGAEPMDNPELLKLVHAGVSLNVITAKFKVSDCHFQNTNDAVIEIHKACSEAKWKEADINTLETMVIDLAGRDSKQLKELVDRALNVFENADPSEYDLMMRELMRKGKVVVPDLLARVGEESERKRAGITDALGRLMDNSPDTVRTAVSLLFDRAKPVRLQAAKCVAALSGPTTFDELCARLKNTNEKQDGLALALGYLHDPRSIEPLVRLLRYSGDPDARICAAFSLGEMHAKNTLAIDALLECVLDPQDEKLRSNAAHALALVGEGRCASYIIRGCQRFRQGRPELLSELRYFKSAEGVEFLLEQLDSDTPAIKKAALETLRQISGEESLDGSEEWRGWWAVNKVRPDWVRTDAFSSPVPAPGMK